MTVSADVLGLLLSQPLWLVLAAITVVLHIGFVVAIRRWLTQDSAPRERDAQPPGGPRPKPPGT